MRRGPTRDRRTPRAHCEELRRGPLSRLFQPHRWRSRPLPFLDAPEHWDRRFGDASKRFAEGATGNVLADRHIERDFESAALDLVGEVAAPRLVFGGEPGLAQGLDRLVA